MANQGAKKNNNKNKVRFWKVKIETKPNEDWSFECFPLTFRILFTFNIPRSLLVGSFQIFSPGTVTLATTELCRRPGRIRTTQTLGLACMETRLLSVNFWMAVWILDCFQGRNKTDTEISNCLEYAILSVRPSVRPRPSVRHKNDGPLLF